MNNQMEKLLNKLGIKVKFKKLGPFVKEIEYGNGVKINFVVLWIVPLLIVTSLFAFLLKETFCNNSSSLTCILLGVISKPFEFLLPLLNILGS